MKYKLGRFALIGIIATAIDIGLLYALHHGAGWNLVVADLAAIAAAAPTSWFLNRRLTFQNDPFVRWVHRPAYFGVTAAVAAIVDLVVLVGLAFVVVDGSADILLAKIPAVACAALVRLAVYRVLLVRSIRRDQQQPIDRLPAPGDVRLSVVVPAYFEQDGIAETIRRLRDELGEIDRDGGLEIVVVDDGSTDDTAEVARRNGADQVVVQPRNMGKGAAVRAGMLVARGRTMSFTDADLAYSPDHILVLLGEIEDGWDVVAGSRRHLETTTLVKARRMREIGGRVINALTYAVLLGHYRDTQCGLKAFRSDVAQQIFGHSRVNGFAFDIEVFHLVERYRLTLTEVPVRVENSATSTVHVVRDAFRLVRDLFRIRRWGKQGRYTLTDEERALISRPTPV